MTLRSEQVRLQIALLQPLFYTKGFAAPESKAAVNRARELIQAAEKLGEISGSPLLLLSVLNGAFATNYANFNGDNIRVLSGQVLAFAEKIGGPVPLPVANNVMGMSLLTTGEIGASVKYFRRAVSLYDPAAHQDRARQSINDPKSLALVYLSWAEWLLGHPEVAIKNAKSALAYAREIDQAATLLFAVSLTALTHFLCGNHEIAMSQVDELTNLASAKDAEQWRAAALIQRGYVCGAIGRVSDAVENLSAGLNLWRSTGATLHVPLFQGFLAFAKGKIKHLEEASQIIDHAIKMIETTKETWCQAEVTRIAGEIALMSAEPDAAKAGEYFERALTIARQQQAKSWELRAAMSMARLWREQGKRDEARDLLGPVYGWFTEGFDTLDLKEAKALLAELAS